MLTFVAVAQKYADMITTAPKAKDIVAWTAGFMLLI